MVDGVDVREMAQDHLRGKIGFVPQKAVLFSGTIAENVRYGRQEATEEEIRHALEVAQASEFVDEMPEGTNATIPRVAPTFPAARSSASPLRGRWCGAQKSTSLMTRLAR
jgi:ABC-type transport system involved in Fe-S cluster assembly fused permease/ATPase subunit